MLKKKVILRAVFITAFLVLAGLIYALSRQLHFPEALIDIDTDLSQLPRYAGYSLLRMFLAYCLSFFFSIFYGFYAATSPKAEGPMVSILDILQSIPILGFFPVAVMFFVSLFNGNRLGVEAASVFLIFTSMSWNMAFSVYESFKTAPSDLIEVSGALGLSGWRRFIKTFFPICIPKLIYSSMISWAGGWYFLIAAEIIAIGPIKHELPGLGSFLIHTTESGQIGRTGLGLLLLIAIIIGFSLFIWHPLLVWAEKFRYEFSSSGSPSHSIVLQRYRKIFASKNIRRILAWVSSRCPSIKGIKQPFQGKISKVILVLLKGFSGVMAISILYVVSKNLLLLLVGFYQHIPVEIFNIPLAIGASFLRLLLAYFMALCWTLPVAYWLGKSPLALRIVTPIAEIGASIPAPALFPFIILFAIHVIGGMNGAAVLLILTGMQWYLLFNLIGGVQSIPADLKESAKAFGVCRWHYWRRVFLPAVFPSLITGSITAWGGGWNALIVSEYIVYRREIYSVTGIGAMLDRATYESGDEQMVLLTLLAMILTITFLNRFFWRRLYFYAVRRFKFEY